MRPTPLEIAQWTAPMLAEKRGYLLDPEAELLEDLAEDLACASLHYENGHWNEAQAAATLALARAEFIKLKLKTA